MERKQLLKGDMEGLETFHAEIKETSTELTEDDITYLGEEKSEMATKAKNRLRLSFEIDDVMNYAIQQKNITYANPLSSFEEFGQKNRGNCSR